MIIPRTILGIVIIVLAILFYAQVNNYVGGELDLNQLIGNKGDAVLLQPLLLLCRGLTLIIFALGLNIIVGGRKAQ